MIRAAARLGLAATLSFVAGAWLIAGAQQTAPPASAPQKPQTPPAQTPPVFRRAANLVTVDAYPRREGHIIEGLGPSDFEVLEDGTPQVVDQFEFVRVEAVPEAERRDPNTQAEMLQLAADPHNRVFVTYLDIYHVGITGSHDIRGPLVDMLNRIVAPNDLFGVTTSKLNPRSLVLGRKMLSVEEQLSRYWPWGERNRIDRDPDDEKETYLSRCFDLGLVGDKRPHADDERVSRVISDILIDRRREESTLAHLSEVVSYVGTFREARTLLVLVTDGWRLFRPDNALRTAGMAALATENSGAPPSPLPPIGTGPDGRLGTLVGLNAYNSDVSCMSELARLTLLDNQQTFRDIIALANRKNIVFYPVNPGGLEVFDTPIARNASAIMKDPVTGMPQHVILADMDRHKARVESALTLASNTDGIAVVDTNDLRDGLKRIVNDVSAYYLLGYYSTNSKADAKYRTIKVRVKQPPGVQVAARRGYVAVTAAAEARDAVPAAASPFTDVREAVGQLSRIGGAALFTYGVVAGRELVVVAEIASSQIEMGKWRDGGAVKVSVTGPDGEQVGTASGQIDPGARGLLLRVPRGTGAGPWRVGVTVVGSSGSLDDRFDVRRGSERLLSDPLLYRATGVARNAVLKPVAEFLYHRNERVHVEWTILKVLDQRTARLLDQRGQPIPIAPTLTERDDSGRAILAADLSLAQLSPGDYVLEVTVGSGADTQRRQVALRVVK